MMNVIALAFLLSSFGAIVVLVPESQPPQADLHGYESYMPSGVSQNAVCDQEPCPSSMDEIKDTLHQGYEKPVENIERAKGSAKETEEGVYQQAKYGVQDKSEQAKEGLRDKVGQVKGGAETTAQQAKHVLQDKAGQAMYGVQETVGDVKRAVYGTGEKISSAMPSKEEAVSFIPGVETGTDVADILHQKVGEAQDKIASVSYGRDSLDDLRKKLEDVTQQVSSYMQGREENDAAYLSFVDLKRGLDEASSYIPSKVTVVPYIPGKDNMEEIRKNVQESTQEMHDKAADVSESGHNAAQDTAGGWQDAGSGASGGYMSKLGQVFDGMKERLTGGENGISDGSGQLERRVHELCSWIDGGVETHHRTELDVAAMRESFAYLMESAVGSIGKAQEVFERAAEKKAGREWREKYVYLADSAKGAVEAAKEVFERTAAVAAGTGSGQVSSKGEASSGKASSTANLRAAARQRVSASVRPILRWIYVAAFSALYGITLWMTFLSGHLLSCSLPRHQFAIVQSKLFPTYLRLLSSGAALCGIVHGVLHPWPSADRSEQWQYANFALCVGLSLLNLLVMEPRATKMMFERLKFEKEEGRGQSGEEVDAEVRKAHMASIDPKFKGLHQIASWLNLGIVAGLTWHLWYLANRVVV